MNDFKLKPGQIDYTNVKRAPVINCVVKFGDKFLVMKRSEKLNFYPGLWNGVSGFMDDDKSVEEKVKEEIREELSLGEKNIVSITQGKVFEQEESKYDKTWIVPPVLVEIDTDEIKLDWEAEDYKWLDKEEIWKLNLLPGFDRVLKELLY